ncbi:MAG: phosphatase PAP2 family protein [Armatimonadota bacterium]|nr:phosphatase PAP2 family protein [Armatimonadota bacterium]
MDAVLAADRAATLWINQHHHLVLDVLLSGLSYLGDAGIAWMLVALALLIFGRRRERLLAVIFIGGLLLTELVAMPFLRELWPRPRPYIYMPQIRTLGPIWPGSSFPSAHGHLLGQATLLFGVAYRRFRWPLIVLLVLSLYSRPYVGMHHALDALAGAMVGFAMGGVELAVAGKLGLLAAEEKQREPIQPEVQV